MIFVVLGLIILVISFIIALVSLIREQKAIGQRFVEEREGEKEQTVQIAPRQDLGGDSSGSAQETTPALVRKPFFWETGQVADEPSDVQDVPEQSSILAGGVIDLGEFRKKSNL